MNLGCKLSADKIQDLRNIFTECGLFPDALVQMDNALNGPHCYKGAPWKFDHPNLFDDDCDNYAEFSRVARLLTAEIEARMVAYSLEKDDHDICGVAGCQATKNEAGGNLLMCSKCEERKYCPKACQTKHWKYHKLVCNKAV
ncbi:hypothetical protein CERZMDRAFT_95922 [Cercospora zeae-maydis SCOH1-5]|uniref:MYND-type domain-containing protein n=1 Tax=Cercospora zeae-maydis SCOH1-5 TaxID=717836 RepID=A0A6A6FKS6_9PEZI|nr:hypothetical protein CERZMDRAFT_95922 [Cercospora zeae-maydis SCOH1-5]